MADHEREFELERDEPIENAVSRDELAQAVMFVSDWTVQTIASQLQSQNIALDPRFQRRDAWRLDRKSQFIESLILGLPIPQVVLAEKKEKRGQYLVLDGKQRLMTVLQFLGRSPESKNNSFRLTGLDLLPHLNGLRFDDLRPLGDEALLLNYTIRSSVIRNWPNEKFLETVFVRLNQGSVRLSPQELRQALFPGPFTDFLDDYVTSSHAVKQLLGLDHPDFRMRDNELFLRLLSFYSSASTYAGDLKSFLDNSTKRFNHEWQQSENQIKQMCNEIQNGIAFGMDVFGEEYFGRKWIKGKFEPLLNRAVLEVMIFYFSQNAVREAAAAVPRETIVGLYKKLCEKNDSFLKSIETTTKSLDSTATRFEAWGLELQSLLGGVVHPVRRNNNRLIT